MVAIDVLHACDLGCTQDAVGHILWEALEKLMKGNSRAARLQRLQLRLKGYYKSHKPPAQIQTLTLEMIRSTNGKKTKTPKLRAQGAETRHIVPFALELAQDLHHKFNSSHSQTLSMVSKLFDFYMNLDLDVYNVQWGRSPAANSACFINRLKMKRLPKNH